MILKIKPEDISKNAENLLAALKNAGVDLRDEPGTPGKLWRALSSSARQGLTPAFLAEIQARGEMNVEKDAVAARFDATGKQNPADLAFLVLSLFCVSPDEAFEMAVDVLALLQAKKAGLTAPAFASENEAMQGQPIMGQSWRTPADSEHLLT